LECPPSYQSSSPE